MHRGHVGCNEEPFTLICKAKAMQPNTFVACPENFTYSLVHVIVHYMSTMPY
jgi:hypothetical protein